MKAAVGAAGAEASSDKEERAAEPSTQKASVGHADSAAPPETLAESAVRATAPLTAAEPSTQKASVGHADGAATPETLAESAVRATAPLTAEGMNAMLQSFFKDFRTELRADQAGSRAEQAGFEKRVESLFVKASEQTATLDTKVTKLTGRVDAVTKLTEQVNKVAQDATKQGKDAIKKVEEAVTQGVKTKNSLWVLELKVKTGQDGVTAFETKVNMESCSSNESTGSEQHIESCSSDDSMEW